MPTGRAYRVSGTVQGVGFRWWTVRAAKGLDLRGSVRNEPDGSVLVLVWGEGARLDELERRLHDGPAGALVERVLRLEPPAPPPPDGFGIDG